MMMIVLPKNVPSAEELLSIEGERITDEGWTDEDIVEQTTIDAIDAEGGVVEWQDKQGETVNPFLLLPAACHVLSEVLWLCSTWQGPEFYLAQKSKSVPLL